MINVRKKLFFTIAREDTEFKDQVTPNPEFLKKVMETGADIFSFHEKSWCFSFDNTPIPGFYEVKDNVALLDFTTYNDWLAKIINKTHHNPVKRAQNKGLVVKEVIPDEEFSEGVLEIYNDTPIRQNRKFEHYGKKLEDLNLDKSCIFIGAYFETKLVGFIQLIYGEHENIVSQILSLTEYQNKNINKAMIAKAVEITEKRDLDDRTIIYGRMGNHPSLDKFKEENGFVKYPIMRYYIPLTFKGRLAIFLSLHRDLKDIAPKFLIPVYNWFSRRGI
jgi:hypothetical protein